MDETTNEDSRALRPAEPLPEGTVAIATFTTSGTMATEERIISVHRSREGARDALRAFFSHWKHPEKYAIFRWAWSSNRTVDLAFIGPRHTVEVRLHQVAE